MRSHLLLLLPMSRLSRSVARKQARRGRGDTDMAAWHWIVLGIVLAIAETMLPGTILLWLGIAAALTGIVLLAWSDLGWQGQVLLFGAIAVVAVGVGLALRRKLHKPQPRDVNLGTQRFGGSARGALHRHQQRARRDPLGRHGLAGRRARPAGRHVRRSDRQRRRDADRARRGLSLIPFPSSVRRVRTSR